MVRGVKGTVIALDHWRGRAAAALMVDGILQDLIIDPPQDGPPGPGTIYRAIVDRPLKGLGGAILRLPEGTGFLRKGNGLAPGSPVVVQVVSYADLDKAPPVTTRLIFKSRYAIVTPGAPGLNIARSIRDDDERDRLMALAYDALDDREANLILRSAAATAPEEEVRADIGDMVALAEAVLAEAEGKTPDCLVDAPGAHHLAWREWSDLTADDILETEGCFETAGVTDAIADLSAARVALKGGGSFYVEATRAMVAVDVNTDGDTSPAAGLKTNLGVARALPRALRLRGLGGQIVIDWAPMPKKDRKQLEQALRKSFGADGIETALVGWTPLGHFELQRKRERVPLFGGFA